MKPFTKVHKELTKESLFSRAKYCCSDIIDDFSLNRSSKYNHWTKTY